MSQHDLASFLTNIANPHRKVEVGREEGVEEDRQEKVLTVALPSLMAAPSSSSSSTSSGSGHHYHNLSEDQRQILDKATCQRRLEALSRVLQSPALKCKTVGDFILRHSSEPQFIRRIYANYCSSGRGESSGGGRQQGRLLNQQTQTLNRRNANFVLNGSRVSTTTGLVEGAHGITVNAESPAVHHLFSFLAKEAGYGILRESGGGSSSQQWPPGNMDETTDSNTTEVSSCKVLHQLEAKAILSKQKLSSLEDQHLQKMVISHPEIVAAAPSGTRSGEQQQGKDPFGSTRMSAPKCFAKVSFGCKVIDETLFHGGGLPRGTVTEIAGVAGAGKTQFALQMALSTLAMYNPTGTGSVKVVYLVSEDVPHARMEQIAKAFGGGSGVDGQGRGSSSEHSLLLLKNLLIRKIKSDADIHEALSSLRRMMISTAVAGNGHRSPLTSSSFVIPLIILDSIAAALTFTQEDTSFVGQGIRREEEAGHLQQHHNSSSQPNSQTVLRVGAALRAAAQHFNAAVVCLNQVRQRPGLPHPIPALGVNWASIPHTKIMLTVLEGHTVEIPPSSSLQVGSSSSSPSTVTLRRLTVTCSSFLPSSLPTAVVGKGVGCTSRVNYVITEYGVQGISPS